MLKLNTRGFAHHIAIMTVVVVVAIGGIGSYIFLRESDAAVAKCGSGYRLAYSTDVIFPNGLRSRGGSGTELARLDVYKNTKTQKVCGMLVAKNQASGVAKNMRIFITLEKKTSNPVPYDWQAVKGRSASSNGTFRYYAGPIYVSYKGYAARNQNKATVKKGFHLAVYGQMNYKKHIYREFQNL